MAFLNTKGLLLQADGTLEEIISELITEVPEKAENIFVAIRLNFPFQSIKNAEVFVEGIIFPVQFESTFNAVPSGTVVLRYDLSNTVHSKNI